MLNSSLLFVVLLYIYPLKFMFDSFMFEVFGLQVRPDLGHLTIDELARASILYGLGFFILMSDRNNRRRNEFVAQLEAAGPAQVS